MHTVIYFIYTPIEQLHDCFYLPQVVDERMELVELTAEIYIALEAVQGQHADKGTFLLLLLLFGILRKMPQKLHSKGHEDILKKFWTSLRTNTICFDRIMGTWTMQCTWPTPI